MTKSLRGILLTSEGEPLYEATDRVLTLLGWKVTRSSDDKQEYKLEGETYQVHDLLTDERFLWRGSRNFVKLDPHTRPAHIFRLRRHLRTEHDFDYKFPHVVTCPRSFFELLQPAQYLIGCHPVLSSYV